MIEEIFSIIFSSSFQFMLFNCFKKFIFSGFNLCWEGFFLFFNHFFIKNYEFCKWFCRVFLWLLLLRLYSFYIDPTFAFDLRLFWRDFLISPLTFSCMKINFNDICSTFWTSWYLTNSRRPFLIFYKLCLSFNWLCCGFSQILFYSHYHYCLYVKIFKYLSN